LTSGFAQAAIRLSEYRKISPGPIKRFIFHDHPTGYDRFYMAMPWKSEHLANKPLE
jgi:STE24 endopeptidase